MFEKPICLLRGSGGKLTFARELIDKWILEKTEWVQPIVVAGCGDELVKEAVDRYNDLAKGLAYYSPVGEYKGAEGGGGEQSHHGLRSHSRGGRS